MSLDKIPTSVEFAQNLKIDYDDDFWYIAMEDFAKMHVENALNKVAMDYDFDEKIIMDSYPLTNIN